MNKTKPFRRVLAVETSCDDTSVAIVDDGGWVHAVLSVHQNDAHKGFGGVVPEIASRHHTEALLPMLDQCLKMAGYRLDDIDGFAVTSRPGLIGSLLVGLVTVKTLSLVTGKPFIGVNHLEGHLMAPFLRDETYQAPEGFVGAPHVALAISGGHTSLYSVKGDQGTDFDQRVLELGHTVDDAAGEAFDKFGKMLGLGFPGGVLVDRHSSSGDPQRFHFPRAMIREDHLNFSFSGLKAAAERLIRSLDGPAQAELKRDRDLALKGDLGKVSLPSGILSDLCASFQEAVVDVLVDRLSRAVESERVMSAILTGGVSANRRLRQRSQQWADAKGLRLAIPPIRYCTDNAAMIGLAGIRRLQRGEFSDQLLGPEPKAFLGRTDH